MGDRCNCNLFLHEAISDEALEILKDTLGEPNDSFEDRQFSFEEVNYAELPDALRKLLVADKTPFAWTNGAGDDYPEGVLTYDGISEPFAWVMLENNIMLTVAQARDPGMLAKAIATQTFYDGI